MSTVNEIKESYMLRLINWLGELTHLFGSAGLEQTHDKLLAAMFVLGRETGQIREGKHKVKMVPDVGEEEDTTPLTLSIEMYIHCKKCLEELPNGMSPREYASLEVGFTKHGLQVWCRRHEMNVMHIDFEGKRHPATMDAVPVPADDKSVAKLMSILDEIENSLRGDDEHAEPGS